jgi:adenylylsulfate kinase-like enzyme
MTTITLTSGGMADIIKEPAYGWVVDACVSASLGFRMLDRILRGRRSKIVSVLCMAGKMTIEAYVSPAIAAAIRKMLRAAA